MDLWASRAKKVDPATYVGQQNRLWYNPVTNSIFVSDGVTPGGAPVALATGANIVANIVTVNSVTSTSGNVEITGNLVITGDISPATETKIGGIKAGPGANVSNDGTLTIDTAGLPLSFGDFTANLNVLTLVNEDQDMVLATMGNAEVQLVGDIGFYTPNGLPPDLSNRYFSASRDGQIKIIVPSTDPLGGAVEIVGSTSGETVIPAVAGVMLHVTGNNNEFATIYNDGVNNFSNYIGRRYNGTAASPTQVKAGNVICRFSGTGYGTTVFPAGAAASVSIVALEDFTDTQQGAQLQFLTAPVGSLTRQLVANIDVANGVSATKFTGNLIGNVTGTATTATNLAAATGILAGAISVDPVSVSGDTSSTQTFTLTGLTTNHKVVITAGTAFNSGLIIQAAWASADNTISIEFRNTTNQAINAGIKTIQYFAWI
jgi:hypothetical protein